MESPQTARRVTWHQCTNISETNSGSIISFNVWINSSPTTISIHVAVYNLGRLCIQWRQNPDGRATVGLCTVCALAPLDTAHSHIRLHWTQLNWVLEDMWFCYSLTGCYRPKSADSLCGITTRQLVTLKVWFITDLYTLIVIQVTIIVFSIITQYKHL